MAKSGTAARLTLRRNLTTCNIIMKLIIGINIWFFSLKSLSHKVEMGNKKIRISIERRWTSDGSKNISSFLDLFVSFWVRQRFCKKVASLYVNVVTHLQTSLEVIQYLYKWLQREIRLANYQKVLGNSLTDGCYLEKLPIPYEELSESCQYRLTISR